MRAWPGDIYQGPFLVVHSLEEELAWCASWPCLANENIVTMNLRLLLASILVVNTQSVLAHPKAAFKAEPRAAASPAPSPARVQAAAPASQPARPQLVASRVPANPAVASPAPQPQPQNVQNRPNSQASPQPAAAAAAQPQNVQNQNHQCSGGQTWCGNRCANCASDNEHCGHCGNPV